LADPAVVARALPGLQRDAGAEPVAGRLEGRLKVRVGGSSITYRGALRWSQRPDGGYAVEGEGVEVRGSGSVTLSLVLRLAPEPGGCRCVFAGTAGGDGRFAELDAGIAANAGRRVLRRFVETLAAVAGSVTAENAGERAAVGDADEPVEQPLEQDMASSRLAGEPLAEAAHARRTMIGRSAEEVDHAPPRGRYAPVPAPVSLTAHPTLRWAAPVAAVALASAVVITRALRKRR
jgi:carbon monoxide dehydrogenase subunit G